MKSVLNTVKLHDCLSSYKKCLAILVALQLFADYSKHLSLSIPCTEAVIYKLHIWSTDYAAIVASTHSQCTPYIMKVLRHKSGKHKN